ncbi:hypothetical protein ACIBCR_01680 [Micromonospora echinospora]|uniref:hypothetical protein n=1 Tax=Micromonospora echinospora TaxID=1877 RepID=UPI0037BCB58E
MKSSNALARQAAAKLARVSSLDLLTSHGPASVGLALIAPAIAHFDATAVLAACAVVCFAAALVPSSRRFSARPRGSRGCRAPRTGMPTYTLRTSASHLNCAHFPEVLHAPSARPISTSSAPDSPRGSRQERVRSLAAILFQAHVTNIVEL